ncbi:MAG TPA: 30S ribosomal protein S16 [Thermoanaerobaculia bacterium]|jgi:small subunit ribosomal protein S16|nr:30S ribosomal protein S16 [Thermoanaerobaculia bacterium]
MVKIRLRRMGSRNHPFFRVVVSDARKVTTSAALDEIGYYDPRKQPAIVSIDRERVDHWVAKGALLSPTVSKLLEKAGQQAQAQPPAKPKAKPKAEAPVEAQPQG